MRCKKPTKKNRKKEIRRIQGKVRWPFGPPHLTLKPSKKNTKKTKKTKKTRKKEAPKKRQQKYQKK